MTTHRTYAAALGIGALLLSGTAAAPAAAAAPAPAAAAAHHTTADARLRCGGNISTYYKHGKRYQKLVHKNCTNHSVHRKAAIARRADGPCKLVSPHSTRTLVRNVRMKNGVHIRGSKPC